MPMTREQLNRLNKNLPPEDRMTWEDYQASLNQDTGTGASSSTGTTTSDTGSGINIGDVTGINSLPFMSEEDAAALQKALAGLDIFANFDPFGLKGVTGETDGSGNKGDNNNGDGNDGSGNDGDGNNNGDSQGSNETDDSNDDNSSSYSSSSSSYSVNYADSAPVVSSVPNTATSSSAPSEPAPPIKTAPIDTILFDNDAVDTNLITDLLFENVGGQEILSIARYDTVNGQDVSYQPIKNLNILQDEYNPNNLLKLQKTSTQIFANYPIDLNSKVPYEGNGVNGESVYIDGNGNLVIELVNLESDEQVEVQITTSGTIYEVGI